MNLTNGNYRLVSAICIVVLLSCRADRSTSSTNRFPETFEEGSKTAYTAGEVALRTGAWLLNGCLIGKTDKDHGNGKACVRMKGGGMLTMMFDIPGKVTEVRVVHSMYGTDSGGKWSLWASKDGGGHWKQAGREVVVGSTIATASIAAAMDGPVRFEIRAGNGGRINIDDVDIRSGAGPSASGDNSPPPVAAVRDDNMALGNPSGATARVENKDNYLLVHPQYTLSYNNSKGMANWVSWQLSTAWRGTVKRCNCFLRDDALPKGYRAALPSDYIGTGFERGHLCPSEDRKTTTEDNAATFLMTNMSPQTPALNEQTWEHLESYCRKLTSQGNELYIIAGGYGCGGEGSNGGIVKSIAGGAINVPSHFWKIAVVLPAGSNDVKRINANTRVIAVDMPNVQSVSSHDWDYYRTTVKALEAATGYDFLSNVPKSIQDVIEAKVDNGPKR